MPPTDPTILIDLWQSSPNPNYSDDRDFDIFGYNAWEMNTGQLLGRSNLDWGPRKWKQRCVARFDVVGESFNMEGLQHVGFNRGAPVELRVEPNVHGVNGEAIAVYEGTGSAQGGHISNEDLPVVLNLLRDEGPELECIVWREVRGTRDGRRCSLEVLLFRKGALRLGRAADPDPPAAEPKRRGLLSRILGR